MDDALAEEGDAWKSPALEVIRCLSLFQNTGRRFKALLAGNHNNRNGTCLVHEFMPYGCTLAQRHLELIPVRQKRAIMKSVSYFPTIALDLIKIVPLASLSSLQ